MRAKGLVLVVGRKDGDAILPDAFGCYIGPNTPVEVEEGTSWRDALADETARANALEDLLASLGVEVQYHDDVVQLPDGVQTLAVNGEAWEIRP